VKEQMGHSSIQVTVDTYGHLIPGANINWVDGLDRRTTPQQNATSAQPERERISEELPEVVENVGERGRNRTSNLLIKSQLLCQLSYAPIREELRAGLSPIEVPPSKLEPLRPAAL
jgi:hypothetical protein